MSSLYIHVPFCDHICAYCDFCKVFYKEEWADQYLDALSYEILDKELPFSYDTIYIGGGTPSSLSEKQLQKLFDILQPYTQNIQEYSIEINPESMTLEKLELLVHYGINRISIGVQSFDDGILKRINRYHNKDFAIEWIKKCQEKGIQDINIDLMYGLPSQSLEHVYHDIDLIDKLDVSHVSVYSLILEDHTVLKNQNYKPLNDEEDAYWYEHINAYLKSKGFLHYEVSNYYKDKPSLHNLVYWHYEDYDGVGLSAHSLKNHHRYENTCSLTRYMNHFYLQDDIELSRQDEMFEMIMMGLRLREGMSLALFFNKFRIDFKEKYACIIDKYEKLNMLVVEDGYIKTTLKGMNYLNTILVDFLE